jgi:hypothetical protein
MKLYIYNRETMEVVAIVEGETNEECESKALSYETDDTYAWSYNDPSIS